MSLGRTKLLLILAILALPGCGIFSGSEDQDSDVVITHTCSIDIAESAAVKGSGDSDDMLHILSYPDCRVEISTEMLEGDHVVNIEEQRSRGRPIAIPVPNTEVWEQKTTEEIQTTPAEGGDTPE